MLLLMTHLLLTQMIIAVVICGTGTVTLHRCMLQVMIDTFRAHVELIILDRSLKLTFLLEALGRHETGNEGLASTLLRGSLLLLYLPQLLLLF